MLRWYHESERSQKERLFVEGKMRWIYRKISMLICKINFDDGCTTLNKLKNHFIIPFKWVNGMEWKLCLNKAVQNKHICFCSEYCCLQLRLFTPTIEKYHVIKISLIPMVTSCSVLFKDDWWNSHFLPYPYASPSPSLCCQKDSSPFQGSLLL